MINRDPELVRLFRIRGMVTALARACDISTAAVSQWRQVPAWHVDAVSRVTRIPPQDLRPDLFRKPAKVRRRKTARVVVPPPV